MVHLVRQLPDLNSGKAKVFAVEPAPVGCLVDDATVVTRQGHLTRGRNCPGASLGEIQADGWAHMPPFVLRPTTIDCQEDGNLQRSTSVSWDLVTFERPGIAPVVLRGADGH